MQLPQSHLIKRNIQEEYEKYEDSPSISSSFHS